MHASDHDKHPAGHTPDPKSRGKQTAHAPAEQARAPKENQPGNPGKGHAHDPRQRKGEDIG